MESRDNSLNNPNQIQQLDAYNLTNHVDVIPLTQEEYDLRPHDPEDVYIILDSPSADIYLGDKKLPKPAHINQYLLAIGEHRKSFIIYLNMVSNYRDNLVPVAEFNDINDAILALYEYRHIGTHTNLGAIVCEILEHYQDNVYGINEAIINMIAASGFRDDQRLQYLNEEAIHYGVTNKDRVLPQYYVAALHNLKSRKPDSTIVIYSDIYDIFVKYDFLKEVKPDEIKNVICDILTAMHSYVFAYQ